MKRYGAARCQPLSGTWNATSAANSPATTNTAWRARKYQGRYPVYADASAIAIDAEYTITSPIASSSKLAQARVTS